MKSSIKLPMERIAEQVAEDETGELMANLMSSLMREFKGCRSEFGQWMQAAMNAAIALEAGDEWSDQFLKDIENAAIGLF